MSSKRGKQKEVVEEDFEAFVRHRLSSISDDLKEMKGTQVKIQRDIESLQGQINLNNNLIQSEGFSQLIFEATRITENS